MTFRLFLTAGFVCVLTFIIPQVSLADSIGISPPKPEITIFRGDILHETLNLSRSHAEEKMIFTVLQDGSPLIDIHGQTEITIPAGAYAQDFAYDIDASAATVSEQDAVLQFVMKPNGSAMKDGNGVDVLYALKVPIHISVIDRPEPSEAISLKDCPSLVKELRVTDVTTKQERVDNGQRLIMMWNIKNSGPNPLTDVTSLVRVAYKDNVYYYHGVVASGPIPAGGILPQTTDVLLAPTSPSGRYNVTVQVGDVLVEASVWIVRPQVLWSVVIVVISLFAGAYVLWRLRQAVRRLRSTPTNN